MYSFIYVNFFFFFFELVLEIESLINGIVFTFQVYKLQKSLVLELELRTVLQTAMECYSNGEFPNQTFFSHPHKVCFIYLYQKVHVFCFLTCLFWPTMTYMQMCKDISNLKTRITILEKEVETLNSQLIEERARTDTVLEDKLNKELIVVKNLRFLPHPNRVSEEMVQSMKTIFLTLSDSSLNRSSSSSMHLPHGKIPNWFGIQGKLCSEDIGNYRFGIEVSWMSVEKKHLDLAAKELRRFRLSFK